MNRLLLIGPSHTHTINFYNLIKNFFDEVKVITHTNLDIENIEVISTSFSFKNPVTILSTKKKIREVANSFKPNIVHFFN